MFIVDETNHARSKPYYYCGHKYIKCSSPVLIITTIASVVVLLDEECTTQETKSCYPCSNTLVLSDLSVNIVIVINLLNWFS